MNQKDTKLCLFCMTPNETQENCPFCGHAHEPLTNPPHALEPGTVIRKRYVIGTMQSDDGFSIIYKGFDYETGQKILIREYMPSGFANRNPDKLGIRPSSNESLNEYFMYGLRLFLKEATNLTELHHDNLLGLQTYFSENMTAYMILNYHQAITLDAYIKEKGGTLSEQETLDIINPILDALKHLHANGLYHCNISTSSIYIAEQNKPILVDISAAKQNMADHAKELKFKYQEGFTPPESIFHNYPIGSWSDIYSCGCTIFHMLTGQIPPDSTKRIIQDKIPLLSKTESSVLSVKFQRLISKSLSVKPQKRYKTVNDLMTVLIGRSSNRENYYKAVFSLNVSILIIVFFVLVCSGIYYLTVSHQKYPPIAKSVRTKVTSTLPTSLPTTIFSSVEISNSTAITVAQVSEESEESISQPLVMSEEINRETSIKIKQEDSSKIKQEDSSKTKQEDSSKTKQEDASKPTPSEDSPPTAELILRINGSSAIGDRLMPELCKAFLKSLGATEIKVTEGKEHVILVQGTTNNKIFLMRIQISDTTAGFVDIKNRKCDIVMASRKISPEEQQSLLFLGDMTSVVSEFVIAKDGITLLVNNANPIRELSVEQIRMIFSGRISDWSEVGGTGGKIHIYTRSKASGTFQTFQSLLMKQSEISQVGTIVNYDQDIAQQVALDPNGIGFTNLAATKNCQAIGISDKEVPALRPTFFTVATDDYPLLRYLYLYMAPASLHSHVFNFREFVLSKQGQDIIKQIGFVDIKIKAFSMQRSPNGPAAQRNIYQKYIEETQNALRLSVNFTFRERSFNLDDTSFRYLHRVVEFIKNQSLRYKLLLIGFSDSKGVYEQNCMIALRRAQTVANEFRISGLSIHDIITACEEMPIASNETEEGRAKNRRVEIWIKPY